jgi:hypothetical protein
MDGQSPNTSPHPESMPRKAIHSLFSPAGSMEGREKRAGVMRDYGITGSSTYDARPASR